MEYRVFGNTVVLRLDKGEEVVESISKLCSETRIFLGTISGIGAVSPVTIGYFETGTKEYHSREFIGDIEITSLCGNITTMNGRPYIHIHATISDDNYLCHGGHLNKAIVSATCEIIIQRINGEVDREFSSNIGLNLLKL